jgi:hypothetical protein
MSLLRKAVFACRARRCWKVSRTVDLWAGTKLEVTLGNLMEVPYWYMYLKIGDEKIYAELDREEARKLIARVLRK